MDERNILDHFEKQESLKPALLILCLSGFALGVPAGFTHFFFSRVLPPPGGMGWLKGIILLANQAIFLIMILTYLSKQLQLFSPKRQFYFGAAFILSSIISLPVISVMRSLPEGYGIFQTSYSIKLLFNGFTISAMAISILLLLLFIRKYGEAFARGPKKASDN
ncbi:MAG: hypothetical protein KDC34_10800 [Saprospiraceae bacterium]|nr:hypothetical protein [Saprospiraceae bacterium]